jgi:hypothetical protein
MLPIVRANPTSATFTRNVNPSGRYAAVPKVRADSFSTRIAVPLRVRDFLNSYSLDPRHQRLSETFFAETNSTRMNTSSPEFALKEWSLALLSEPPVG